jgi:hypothetical protein
MTISQPEKQTNLLWHYHEFLDETITAAGSLLGFFNNKPQGCNIIDVTYKASNAKYKSVYQVQQRFAVGNVASALRLSSAPTSAIGGPT